MVHPTKTQLFAIAVLAMLGLAMPTHAVNILSGSGFDSNSDLAEWTVGNDGGGQNPIIQIGSAFGLAPHAGAGYLAYTGNNVSEDGFVEQTVAVTPGTPYALNFQFSGRGGGTGNGTPSVTATASGTTAGDLLSKQYTVATAGTYEEVTEYFTPTTNSVTIRFQESSASSVNQGPGIDSASLVAPLLTMAMLDVADSTTAADNGQSPAAAGQFAGPLYVRERANENDPQLEVEAFLKFDLSGLDPRDIAQATLVLHEDNKLNSANSADLFIARVLEDWDSTGNDPVFAEETTANDGVNGITDVTEEFLFGNNGPAAAGPVVDITHNIDITSWAQLWLADPANNFGVRLRIDDAFVGASFDSAQLIIKQVAAPEPATAVLGVLGFAGLVMRRRRVA